MANEFLNLRDEVEGYDVSTVLAYGSNLYETMVFNDGYTDVYARRYITREDAIQGHKEVCQKVRDGLIPTIDDGILPYDED